MSVLSIASFQARSTVEGANPGKATAPKATPAPASAPSPQNATQAPDQDKTTGTTGQQTANRAKAFKLDPNDKSWNYPAPSCSNNPENKPVCIPE